MDLAANGRFVPLKTQVAGHESGILKDEKKEHVVYKSFGKPQCGRREAAFYTSLKDSNSKDLIELKNLIPRYYGTSKISLKGSVHSDYLTLENLTYGILKPCVMDIKIGKRTWDPLADEEKIKNEESKYSECKEGLGFCIPGFQVFELNTGETKRYDKSFGKQLTPQSMPNALKYFLNSTETVYKNLVRLILEKLYSIQKWFKQQTSFELYSSSILIIYDANVLKTNKKENTLFNGNLKDLSTNEAIYPLTNDWVRVKMIDFAHVFPLDASNEHDFNYLFGINSLIQMLETLVE